MHLSDVISGFFLRFSLNGSVTGYTNASLNILFATLLNSFIKSYLVLINSLECSLHKITSSAESFLPPFLHFQPGCFLFLLICLPWLELSVQLLRRQEQTALSLCWSLRNSSVFGNSCFLIPLIKLRIPSTLSCWVLYDKLLGKCFYNCCFCKDQIVVFLDSYFNSA